MMRLAGSLAVATALSLGAITLALERNWPANLRAHLIVYVATGLVWVGTLLWLRRTPLPSRIARVFALAALGLHACAWLSPPRHSDDVYRYLWDGEVQRAGIDPYHYPPEHPALAHLRDETYARVNNRHLPTIYPPMAQLAFRAAASAPAPLAGWKVLVGLCDLATAGLLLVGAGETAALAWLISPLVLVELAQNGHLEALGVALLTAALLAFARGRRGRGGALVGLASATKILPIYLLATLRDRRVLVAGLLAAMLVWLPYAGAGSAITGSLGEYGRRWRTNDGAFALLFAGAQGLVWAAGKHLDSDQTRLGPLTRVLTGRDRDEAYPDELAGALARLASLAIFVAVVLRVARRNREAPLSERAVALTRSGVGAFLLLTPSLHPWYALWALPAVLLRHPSRERAPAAYNDLAWLWLVALVPLGHAPLGPYLAGAPWRDPTWTRLLEHGPALGLCIVEGARARWLSSPRSVV